MHRSLTSQLIDGSRELLIWLAPTALIFLLVGGLGIIVATPPTEAWFRNPDPISVGLGVALGAVAAARYAVYRLDRLVGESDA